MQDYQLEAGRAEPESRPIQGYVLSFLSGKLHTRDVKIELGVRALVSNLEHTIG